MFALQKGVQNVTQMYDFHLESNKNSYKTNSKEFQFQAKEAFLKNLSECVSVVVTAFKHEGFIRECLDSINNQTTPPKRLIVIDDFSQDRTEEICKDWLKEAQPDFEVLFYFHQNNVGICKSLNEALQEIETTFYCHISADDWIEPTRLETQVKSAISADLETSLFISSIREIDIDGELIVDHDFGQKLSKFSGKEDRSALHKKLLSENIIPAPSVLIRTSSVKLIGGYDENLAFEDYDLWLRLSKFSKILFIDGIVSNYRILDNSMLRNRKRFVTVKMSEAEMLFKHKGENNENDRIISSRITEISKEITSNGGNTAEKRKLNSMLKQLKPKNH
jgi:glycosyltransferase involved in cell wall biosynthesis